jgi:hypothetical protein
MPEIAEEDKKMTRCPTSHMIVLGFVFWGEVGRDMIYLEQKFLQPPSKNLNQ